jgi:hypothetical protein
MLKSVNSKNQNANPSINATICCMTGMALTSLFLFGTTPVEVATRAAYGAGITLIIALGLELTYNWKAALRPDTFAFIGLYFLTFFEFFFPQPGVNYSTTVPAITYACRLCFLAFSTMALGRHLAPKPPRPLIRILQYQTSFGILLTLFISAFFFGILYMLLAVNFNVSEMISQMMRPRFTQPWARGRFGDWKALLNQIGDTMMLVPPLAGLLLARRERLGFISKLIILSGLLFSIFEAVASSTRNLLVTVLVSFLIGYGMNITRKRLIEFLALCVIFAIGFYYCCIIMLDTRSIGLSAYIDLLRASKSIKIVKQSGNRDFFIDLDLVNIAQLTDIIPGRRPYLGWEVPYVAAVGPIPRALWSGKPMGLSLPIEKAVEYPHEDMTITATFVGESYMGGGWFGVALAGLFLGFLTAWGGAAPIRNFGTGVPDLCIGILRNPLCDSIAFRYRKQFITYDRRYRWNRFIILF